jgi:hypothetical protein
VLEISNGEGRWTSGLTNRKPLRDGRALIISFVFFYKEKLRGLSPRANYIDRATAACRRS